MKLNWGTSIIIAFILFIGFILFFVVKATTDKKYDYNLVSDEYYKEELSYQKEIDQYKNTKKLGVAPKFEKTEAGIEIHFPETFKTETINGKVSLYRPSNQQLDQEIPFTLSNANTLLIPKSTLVDGRWDIKMYWKHKEKEYLYKKQFVY